MEKIIVNPADIESCWEKPDACMVKMKTGKVWVCEKEHTMQTILTNKKEKLVELPLKRGGKHGK